MLKTRQIDTQTERDRERKIESASESRSADQTIELNTELTMIH